MMQAAAISRPLSGVPWKPILLALGTLTTLTVYVLAWAFPTFPGDEGALMRLQGLRNGWLDDTAIWFANLGLLWVFMPAAAVLMGCLVLARRYADTAMIFGGLAVIAIGNGLKVIVDRPRPEYQIVDPLQSGLSFPSGHSLLAVILGGVLVYLVGLWVKPVLLRRAIRATLIVMVISMGASRAYLGVHWPSDVIGSYVLGAMALVGLVGLRNAVATDQ
ncbi:MAG TPA: phosphatase PAP2 family protein [Candidatus Poseidoniales archaeon]|nr:phosphatase PAP2 family protein [Candidatus Poseidoniales archaeon]